MATAETRSKKEAAKKRRKKGENGQFHSYLGTWLLSDKEMANIPELQSRSSLLLQTPERRRDFLLVIRKSWTFATTLVLCIVSGRHTRAKVYFWPLNGKQSQWSNLAWHVPHVLESSLLVSVPRFWILAAKSCLFCCHRSVHLVGPPGGPNNSACKAKKKKGARLSNRRSIEGSQLLTSSTMPHCFLLSLGPS